MKRPILSVRASLGWAGLAALGLAAASLNTSDLVLYNPSVSLEPGLYVSADLEVERGAVVTIPVGAVDLAYVEDGLMKPSGARFLKRVAAIEGDRVCSGNGRIT
jgi:type IV secretory pathway protease TraF